MANEYVAPEWKVKGCVEGRGSLSLRNLKKDFQTENTLEKVLQISACRNKSGLLSGRRPSQLGIAPERTSIREIGMGFQRHSVETPKRTVSELDLVGKWGDYTVEKLNFWEKNQILKYFRKKKIATLSHVSFNSAASYHHSTL